MYNLSNSHCNPVENVQGMCDIAALCCAVLCWCRCVCLCIERWKEDSYRQTKTKEILKPNKCSQTKWNEHKSGKRKRASSNVASQSNHLSTSNSSKLNYEYRTLNQLNCKHRIGAASAVNVCMYVCGGITAW